MSALLCGFSGSIATADDGTGTGGASQQFNREDALAISQAAIGRAVADHELLSAARTPVRLADYRGKPLVISLIYTSCYHICPATTQHLADVVEKARDVLGADSFNVLTIGFDTVNDSADAMRIYAGQQGISDPSWTFASADQSVIDALVADLGFLYYPTPSGFDHLVQSSVLDADGVVVRQVYGIRFDTPHLVEPLKALVFGEDPDASLFQQISARVKLFCTVYDPASDRYTFDYAIFVGLTIGLLLGGLFLYLLRREWSLNRASRPAHRVAARKAAVRSKAARA